MFQQPKDVKKSATLDHVDNAASDFKSAKKELKNAKDSAKNEVSELADRAEEKVRSLRDSARDAGERVQHFLSDRREDALHAKDSAERSIRANPLAATVGALVGGILLGRLLSR